MSAKNKKKSQRAYHFGDNLVVKRKGGGSIIDRRPLFSNDGEILYVVWKNVIRANSTKTGDFVREFEKVDNKIIAITFNSDNFNTIIGCTENAELVHWDARNGLIVKKLKFKTHDNIKVKTFHLMKYVRANGHHVCQALLTYVVEVHNDIQLLLCDLDNGEAIKSNCIKHIGDYYVDIIGNHEDNIVALAQDMDLHIIRPNTLTGIWHKIGGGRKMTCVAGHPENLCVATGDTSGRALIWYDLFKKHPVQGTYHWHTLPVTEIAFSRSGGHLYTGGGESVLVKWTVSNPKHKSFLPRLPAPIRYLAVAPENLYIAISTFDNGIVVINPHNTLISVIQNFTWGLTTSKKDLFPAGLVLDPRTGCLVLNSRTGHIQFFNTHTKNLLHNIDITTQNLVSQTRNMDIINTEVTKIALSSDGSWLATVEERNDGISSPEVRLKFWKYSSENQVYSLNTCIELPHEIGVSSLKFKCNTSLDNESLMAVTTGKDSQFKLWNLAEPESMYKTSKHWQCCGFGDYRNLPSMDADFSIDGSLLGVGFGASLTIWNPVTNMLKCSLTHSRYNQTLKRVEFGKHEACHLVVVGSSEHLAVWNLLTLTIIWSVPLKIANLTSDIMSVYMAAFTEDNNLYIFTPQSADPIYTRKNLLDDESTVMGACFVPNVCEKIPHDPQVWLKKSQLFFLDSNQELLTLEAESEAAVSLENLTVNGALPLTAFSGLVPDESSTNVEKDVLFVHKHFGKTGKNMVDELLTVSSHTLPPIRMLCLPFVMSLRVANNRENKLRSQKSSDANIFDADDSMIPEKKKYDEEKIKSKFQKEFEKNSDFVSFNWNFLADIFPVKSCVNDQ